MRHLEGVILRNLTLNPSSASKGRTTDDEGLPSNLASPSKRQTLEEHRRLSATRSLEDIQQVAIDSQPRSATARDVENPRRNIRRKSTLDWGYVTARQRHDRMQESIMRHTADTFFSIRSADHKQPIYVSELVEGVMNPEFRSFNLQATSPMVARQQCFDLDFFSRHNSDSNWTYLLHLSIDLTSLICIGKSLENLRCPLQENSVLLQLSDGIYTSFPNAQSDPQLDASLVTGFRDRADFTSSYDALMRLSMLDDCVQDALNIQAKLTAEIDELISQDRCRFYGNEEITTTSDASFVMKRAIANERKNVRSAKARLNELHGNMQARQEAIRHGQQAQEQAHEHLDSSLTKLRECKGEHTRTIEDAQKQRRRICEDIQRIYPIEPIPGHTLAFTICRLPLPDSEFTAKDCNGETLSAALGHVAHVVYLLSFYLSAPLPYPIQPYSSTSQICDPISLMAGSRNFPLHLLNGSGAVYRFEYGVFLLNKNIELLSSRLGLKVPDIRQTLPNLKYLLFVATAGKGEAPGRKAGGVRALIKGSGLDSTSPASSRRGSDGSNNAVSEALRRTVGGGTARVK